MRERVGDWIQTSHHARIGVRLIASWRALPMDQIALALEPQELSYRNIQHSVPWVCPVCKRETKRHVTVSCRACYQKKRYEKRPQAKCHPERKDHAGGLCRNCYRAVGRVPRATCHPDRLPFIRGLCRICYSNIPEVKARAVAVRRIRKYHLSENDYAEMLHTQEGVCAICHKEQPEHIDHSHETGRVRGLLCGGCNRGIGNLRDNPVVAYSAYEYLKRAQ